MASPNVQEILTESACFRCTPSEKQLMGGMVYLLGQILHHIDPASPVTIQEILSASQCFECSASHKQLLGAIVYLLAQLQIQGDQIQMGDGAPSVPGSDVVIIYFRVKAGCNSIWWWDPATLTWTEFNGEDMTGNYAVPTIVELRAIPTADCPPVSAVTFGNLVRGDGQGAHYYFDADDTAADNGMSVIVPDDIVRPDPGSWLQFSPA